MVVRGITSVLCVLAIAGCGDDGDEAAPAGDARRPPAEAETTPKAKPQPRATGSTVKVAGSEFGTMLFGADDQAIYIFENDPKGKTVCYGECAEAWPPVTTKGQPQAGAGVRKALLGSVKRDDGTTQVPYAGKPLYFYAHEGPGEVRCHNVDLNGGLWWVVGPDGRRRA
jgi:predicted lipoprotein with Yx(FWY)xxD motif